MTIVVGDQTVELASGEHAFGPRDVPHRFTVGPEGARMIWMLTPGGFENLIEEVSVPAERPTVPPPSVLPPENVAELLRRHGNELLASCAAFTRPELPRAVRAARPVSGTAEKADLHPPRTARSAKRLNRNQRGDTGLCMKLYVCWGTFPVPWPRRSGSWRPSAHPCKRAFDALKAAGHSPDVVRVYGFAKLPDVTRGRREVKRLTGESFVPVLVLDDGEIIKDSKNIVAWARGNPRD